MSDFFITTGIEDDSTPECISCGRPMDWDSYCALCHPGQHPFHDMPGTVAEYDSGTTLELEYYRQHEELKANLPHCIRPALNGWLFTLEQIADQIGGWPILTPGQVLAKIKNGEIPARYYRPRNCWLSNTAWIQETQFLPVAQHERDQYHPEDLYQNFPYPGTWTPKIRTFNEANQSYLEALYPLTPHRQGQ